MLLLNLSLHFIAFSDTWIYIYIYIYREREREREREKGVGRGRKSERGTGNKSDSMKTYKYLQKNTRSLEDDFIYNLKYLATVNISGWVSLFNDILTFLGYLMPKASFEKNSSVAI